MMSFVDALNFGPYVSIVMNSLDDTLGRAAPSAAPSLRQRGPRRLPSGERGRLPNLQANPRRDSLSPAAPSRYFTDEFLTPNFSLNAMRERRNILAVAGRVARAPRAMVRSLGMAMAYWALMEDGVGEAASSEEQADIVAPTG
jgi:hypothetical protein